MTANDTAIHEAVRSHYGAIARATDPELALTPASCCGEDTAAADCGCSPKLYDENLLADLPVDVTGLSLGCGDPVTIAGLTPGETVVDLGSGARLYQMPTWASDQRLAFFGMELAQDDSPTGIVLKTYITPADDPTPALAHETNTDTLTYAYWAPANCAASSNCRDLAVLTTTVNGSLSVLRIRDEAPDFSTERIGVGGPFFYSYSPDASRMIWQRFGRQLEVYDTGSDTIIENLPDQVGLMQAPMWSPVDDRLLFSTIDEAGHHNLVIADGEDRQIVATDQRGQLSFAWSPDGQHVAYKLNQGSLHVVEPSSGTEVAVSNTSRVLAFFWSPDGQKIAYLTAPGDSDNSQVREPAGLLAAPARQNTSPMVTWHVLDLANGLDWTHFRGFIPTRDTVYLASFFDQFAQSHRVWSPDSRYLVYGEVQETGVSVISILDATDPAARSQLVTEGQMAVWSFN